MMQVRDLMTPNVISLRSTESVGAAREVLRDHKIHHLLVIDDGAVVGALSYRDIAGIADTVTLAEVMCRDIVFVDADAPVRSAASLMIGRTTGCLPVTSEGSLQGIITTTDLLRQISKRAPSH